MSTLHLQLEPRTITTLKTMLAPASAHMRTLGALVYPPCCALSSHTSSCTISPARPSAAAACGEAAILIDAANVHLSSVHVALDVSLRRSGMLLRSLCVLLFGDQMSSARVRSLNVRMPPFTLSQSSDEHSHCTPRSSWAASTTGTGRRGFAYPRWIQRRGFNRVRSQHWRVCRCRPSGCGAPSSGTTQDMACASCAARWPRGAAMVEVSVPVTSQQRWPLCSPLPRCRFGRTPSSMRPCSTRAHAAARTYEADITDRRTDSAYRVSRVTVAIHVDRV